MSDPHTAVLPAETQAASATLHELIQRLAAAAGQLRRAAASLSDQALPDQCAAWHILKQQHEDLDRHVKDIGKTVRRLAMDTIPAAFDDAGVDKIRVPSVARSFYPLTKYTARMVDRDLAFDWLRANGGEGLITETVHASALAALLKEHVAETNEQPPAEAIEFSSYQLMGSARYNPTNQEND